MGYQLEFAQIIESDVIFSGTMHFTRICLLCDLRPWLKLVSTFSRDLLIRRIDTTTL